jgi:hypothetical protein
MQMMMLSDLSSDDHEATGSSSYGGDMASYALSPLFLAPAASATAPLPPPPQPPAEELTNKQAAGGGKRKRSQPGNPGT